MKMEHRAKDLSFLRAAVESDKRERGRRADGFCLHVREGISQNKAGSLCEFAPFQVKSSEKSCNVVCVCERAEEEPGRGGIGGKN